jgi:hypothetical protein
MRSRIYWRPVNITSAVPGIRALIVGPTSFEEFAVVAWVIEEAYVDHNVCDESADNTTPTGERRIVGYVSVPEPASTDEAICVATETGRAGWRFADGFWGFLMPDEDVPNEHDLAAFRDGVIEEDRALASRRTGLAS